MPPEKRDPSYLSDMLHRAELVVRFTRGKSLADYLGDELLRAAVEREIEVIGEAARRVSANFREAHPEIPWKGIIGQRNVMIHDYGEIVNEKVWDVASVHVPELIRILKSLIPIPPVTE